MKKIAITGASGLVGSRVGETFGAAGWQVLPLVRSRGGASSDEIYWNPVSGEIETEKLEGLDALVHLAGDNVGEGRWSEEKKQRIWSSRVDGTRLLANAIGKLEKPPKVWVSASAIGYYGDRGEERLEESSGPGTGFFAELCQAWEAETQPAREQGVRVVNLRIGVVLDRAGGALPKMVLPFKMGLGGVIASGKQYMSWVSLPDVVGAIRFAVEREGLSGPANAVAPGPVTNREFTKTLGRVVGRPTILPMPGALAKLAFGAEKASEMLLVSSRIYPAALQAAGYEFTCPELEPCLRAALKR